MAAARQSTGRSARSHAASLNILFCLFHALLKTNLQQFTNKRTVLTFTQLFYIKNNSTPRFWGH
jgi:hypothetical protein